MRLVFLGTPASPFPRWKRIVAAGHEVLAVVTQPDRPQGPRTATRAIPRERSGAAARHLRCISRSASAAPEVVEHLRELKPGRDGGGRLRPDHSANRHRPRAARHHQCARFAAAEVSRRGAHPVGRSPTAKDHRRDHHADRCRPRYRRHAAQVRRRKSARTKPRPNFARAWPTRARTCWSRRSPDSPPEPSHPSRRITIAGHARADPEERRRPDRLDAARPADSQSHARLSALARRAYLLPRAVPAHLAVASCADAIRERRARDARTRTTASIAVAGDGARLELLEVQLEGRKRMPAAVFANGHRLDAE